MVVEWPTWKLALSLPCLHFHNMLFTSCLSHVCATRDASSAPPTLYGKPLGTH
jgi:hypothetical protein